jgi:hypothetical protein
MQERQMQEQGEESQPTTSRRGFLRRLATLAAVGIGVAMVPGRAHADTHSKCCPDQTCPSCPNNGVPVLCTDFCSSTTCCQCASPGTLTCVQVPCPCG